MTESFINLKPNTILRGPIFPEPVQVLVVTPMGDSVKLIAKGLRTGQVHEPILSPNLNKLLADRRANIEGSKIDERVRAEVQRVFTASSGVQPLLFPERSVQIPDRPVFTLVVLAPEYSMRDKQTLPLVETMTREHGTSARTFKSALVWAITEDDASLKEEARKALAWEAIRDEDADRLDDSQQQQVDENIKKAGRDLKESVWRTYKNIAMLGKDNTLRTVDLGLIHSSSVTGGIIALILQRLRQDGDVEDNISPNFLVRNWPPAFKEWSTKSVRDAFLASPQFPRLLNPDVVKETIARGVQNGYLAYVGKKATGEYDPFIYNAPMNANEVEISDDVYIITRETEEAYKIARVAPASGETGAKTIGEAPGGYVAPPTDATSESIVEVPVSPGKGATPGAQVTQLMWTGEVPPQKWMNFYTKVLSKFAAGRGLKIRIGVEVSQAGGISEQKVEETRVALRELGLDDAVEVK